MKKVLLLFVILILTSSFLSINAQVKLGLQAGVNLAEVSLDPEQTGFELGTRTGFLVGGIVNYNFSPILSLQAEPAYIQKGSSVDIAETEGGINIKGEGNISEDYIDIPILLKASFGEKIKPFLLAGASVSFLLGDAKLKLDKVTADGQDVTSMLPAETLEQTQKTKSTDFVLNLGGGVMIPVGNVDIFVEGQYNLGLTNINDESNDNTSVKNRGIQIKAGALFSL
jgi:hypothetical protein